MPPDSAPAAPEIVAILRGFQTEWVVAIAEILWATGIRIIEVPLNSPEPFRSISTLARHPGPPDGVVGAGPVLTVEDAQRTHAAGSRLVVAPNCDVAVIHEALRLGMAVMPGVSTATETLAAIRAGAKQLNLFPAVSVGPRHLKALAAVLPAGVRVFPVGGVGAADINEWLTAGATGFGFGSELFKPDYTLEAIGERASRLVEAFHAARRRLVAVT